MTETERMKTNVAFVDTVVRECAMLTIQHESDQMLLERYKEQISELDEKLARAESAELPVDLSEVDALNSRLLRAYNHVEQLMKNGGGHNLDPCTICVKNGACPFGAECQPVYILRNTPINGE